ncbi:MAG: hypothetical protein WA990_00810 [Rubrobacteraceae bacterium]
MFAIFYEVPDQGRTQKAADAGYEPLYDRTILWFTVLVSLEAALWQRRRRGRGLWGT